MKNERAIQFFKGWPKPKTTTFMKISYFEKQFSQNFALGQLHILKFSQSSINKVSFKSFWGEIRWKLSELFNFLEGAKIKTLPLTKAFLMLRVHSSKDFFSSNASSKWRSSQQSSQHRLWKPCSHLLGGHRVLGLLDRLTVGPGCCKRDKSY